MSYTINNSLRFRSSASASLSRTPASSGNRKTWTWSAWVKRGTATTTVPVLFGTRPTSSSVQNGFIAFNSSGSIYFFSRNPSDVIEFIGTTSAVFRDPAAWYHIVFCLDTTQSTSTDRIKVYVNGIQQTSFSSVTYPTQNLDCYWNQNVIHFLGASNGDNYSDGYMTEINFIDGQGLTADDFGEFDGTTGVWKPKAYSGTYGTNGFHLDGSSLDDSSGNNNDWTNNNLNTTTSSASTYDIMTDVPTLTDEDTGNYATLNPLMLRGVGLDLAQGNLYANRNSAGWGNIAATIGVSSGKWYWEFLNDSTAATMVGVDSELEPTDYVGHTSTGYGYYALTGNKYNNRSSSSYGNTYTTGDIVGFALDMDNGKIWFAKNGAWQASGDPVAGTNEAFSGLTGTYFPQFSFNNSGGDGYVNFGQRPFAYTPPTGFKSLNTYNLPDSTIEDGSEQFNTVTFSGTGATGNAITGLGFQPDMVWAKSRSVAANHELADIVRGTSEVLFPNLQNIQLTDSARFESFDSDGFTLGANSNANGSGYSSVGWAWKANGSGSSNSAGTNGASIASTYSANTTSGFSIVTYSGTGSNGTVYHGLGSVPEMMIFKTKTGAVNNWFLYHDNSNTNPASTRMLLNLNVSRATNTTYLNATAPAANVLTVGTDSGTNLATNTYVAYVFAPVEGFSAFGSYTGNGSADGPFIYTGFRPRWVMIKRSSASDNWAIFDTSRLGYNVDNNELQPNSSLAEGSTDFIDIVSNGFKNRNSDARCNASGSTYIYAAFAENPFKNSLAR